MSTDSLFRGYIQPFRIFLNSFGLLYHPLAGCSRWKNLLKSCWTLFWLLLNLHVFLFVLVKRALPVLAASNRLFLLEMNSLMAFFAHINPATMGLLCHTKLVLIVRDGHSLIRKALCDVIPINPSDHFRLRRSSVLVVACIVLSVSIQTVIYQYTTQFIFTLLKHWWSFKIFFNSGFLIIWDYWNPTNTPSNILTVRTVYKHLGIVSHSVFGWSCACLYIVLARHLVFYYRESVMKGWKRTASDNENDILLMLIEFHKLDSFARLLIKDFAPILLVLCCSSLFSCLTASYFMILSYFDGKLIYLAYTWDTFQIIEGFGRLILICWTTDQLVQTPVQIVATTVFTMA